MCSYRVAVIGNNPVASLASIALNKRGHSVKIFEQLKDSYPIENSKTRNIILNSRGILPLLKLDVKIDEGFLRIENIFRHFGNG